MSVAVPASSIAHHPRGLEQHAKTPDIKQGRRVRRATPPRTRPPAALAPRENRSAHAARHVQTTLPSCAGQNARKALPQPAPASSRPPLGIEAQAYDDIKYDFERVRAYCLWRKAGCEPDEARARARYGEHYARCSENDRKRIRALLKEYGVSDAPLCWPAREITLDRGLDECRLLGSGRYNKAIAVCMGEQHFVFRPFVKPAERPANDGGFSLGGELLGLREDAFFPELRYIMAVRIAESVGLAGPAGVVPRARVAIINQVPGLLLERVFGNMEGRDNMVDTPFAVTSPEVRAILEASVAAIRSAPTGKQDEALEKSYQNLGLFCVNGSQDPAELFLTGTLGKRGMRAKERYTSWNYNLSMAKAQVFCRLIGHPDMHAGNLMYERLDNGLYAARVIDLDEAGPPLNPEDVSPDDPLDKAHLSLPVVAMPAELRQELQSERCRAMNASLREELKAYLPSEDLDNLARNERELRDGDFPTFTFDHVWTPNQGLQPHAWLLDRMIGFSAHDFGDSEDSSVDDDTDTGVAASVFPNLS